MKNLKLILLVSLIIVASSCSYRMTDFTIVSTKNVTLNGVNKKTPRVIGKYVTVQPKDAIKEAVDKALQNAGPGYDALIDGVVRVSTYWAVLLNIYVYKVEGTPIKTSEINNNK